MKIDNLFLSAGAMKAGTSWLFKQLEDHPDILSTPIKEIHYFSHTHTNSGLLDYNARIQTLKSYVSWLSTSDRIERIRRDLRWFEFYVDEPIDDAWFVSLFSNRGPQKYWAEFSNMLGTLSDAAWEHVVSLATNVKVVYTLREPLSRLWSHARFHHAFNNAGSDLSSWSKDDFCRYLESDDIVSHGRYADNIARMRKHLSSEQLLICFFESFRSDPLGQLVDIERFLRISHKYYNPQELQRVHNPSPQVPMPSSFIEAARHYVMPELEKLASIGIRIPESWRALDPLSSASTA